MKITVEVKGEGEQWQFVLFDPPGWIVWSRHVGGGIWTPAVSLGDEAPEQVGTPATSSPAKVLALGESMVLTRRLLEMLAAAGVTQPPELERLAVRLAHQVERDYVARVTAGERRD